MDRQPASIVFPDQTPSVVQGALVLILATFFFLLPFAQTASAEKAQTGMGSWAVLVETDPKPKTCWAATPVIRDQKAKQNYFLAVSRYRGQPDPQVSIYSDKRLARSAGLYLIVAGRTYRLRSDGYGAWTEQRVDKRIVADMVEVSKAKDPNQRIVIAGQSGGIEVKVRIDGLEPALARVLAECSRP